MHRTSAPASRRNSKNDFKLISSLKCTGIIESFTLVHNAPLDFESKVPYFLALIKLDNGDKIISQVADCKKLSIGMKVEPCLRRIFADGDSGLISYGTKFRLIK